MSKSRRHIAINNARRDMELSQWRAVFETPEYKTLKKVIEENKNEIVTRIKINKDGYIKTDNLTEEQKQWLLED